MKLANRTRYSSSIPNRLLREGSWHLLPLYYLARLSYLGAEGIENSGSYHFADHIYVGKPKGRFAVGKLLDAALLSLPSSRSFRSRFIHSRDVIVKRGLENTANSYRVLSVPCGIPRDLIEAARELEQHTGGQSLRTTFYCLDLDPAVLSETSTLLASSKLSNFQLIQSDAFDETAYPAELDLITSTGFAEFLDEQSLVRFYNICFRRLRPGGVFITSSTVRHKLSDYFLRNIAELLASYRDEESLRALFAQTPFQHVALERDQVGFQVLVTAARVV